jgi:predicted Zn-dependent peptidase
MSSRLFQEVREKRGLAYTISSFCSSYVDSGILGIYTGTSNEKANKLLDVVFTELKKLAEKVTVEELKRAKAQVRAALLMSQESSVSRAERLAGNYAAFGRYISTEEIIEKINAIDAKKVKTFAAKILSNKHIPTLASIGKIAKLYNYEDVVKKLRS